VATPKQKVKVGVFLVSCAVIIAVSLGLVSGLHEDQGLRYWIEFDESILGLPEGGLVEYLGVPVGRVRDITVTGSNKAHVEIVIDPRKVELREGVRAQLVLYSLAAGTMAISLSSGESKAPALAPDSQIPTKASIFAAISTQIQELLDDLASIADSLNVGLAGTEEGELAGIVKQVSELLGDGRAFVSDGRALVGEATETIADLRGDARRVLDELATLCTDVRGVAEKADRLAETVTEKVEVIDVDQLQTRLNDVLEELAQLTERVGETLEEVDVLPGRFLHEADNLEHSIRRTLDEMRGTLGTVQAFVDELREDPSSLIRGKRGPRGGRE